MQKIRWGIVGPGEIANKFAKAIKNVSCADLVAVASRTEKNGRDFAQRYQIPQAFCGYELMAASDMVDAVYISTPHPFHYPCAELFLRAGKHVLCEKPMCVNASQAERLKVIAKENGVFLMEAMWTRFLPAIREAYKIVEEGKIGSIRGLEADFCYASTPEEEAKLFQNEMAGGALLDVGVYGLHFASIFLGDAPLAINATAHIEKGVDIHTNIQMQYTDGAIASISSAIGVEKPRNAYIYGSKGYIYLPNFYGATELHIHIDGEDSKILKPCLGEGFEEEIYEACACIDAGKIESDLLPLDKTIAMLKQMDVIRAQLGIVYPFDK